MSSTSKKLVIFILILTVIVAGAAIYISIELNKEPDITPTVTPAASEEVTSAEIANYDENWDWNKFNAGWLNLVNDDTKTWEDYVEYSLNEGARYSCDKEILKVGEEQLYGCDLNAIYVIYDTLSYIRPQSISPQDESLNMVLDKLITDSGMLQKAEELKLTTLDSSIFNSPDKDMFARFEILSEIRPQIISSFQKTFDFEMISIYFFNEKEGEIPVAEAQVAAKSKMDGLYERLKSGDITMEEAGVEIMDDKIEGDDTGVSLSQMDKLYQENAYAEIVNKEFSSPVFTDPSLDNEIRSLGEGQMSTVRLCKDQKFTSEEFLNSENGLEDFAYVDSCYIIFKVNKINLGLKPDENLETADAVEEFINKTVRTNNNSDSQ